MMTGMMVVRMVAHTVFCSHEGYDDEDDDEEDGGDGDGEDGGTQSTAWFKAVCKVFYCRLPILTPLVTYLRQVELSQVSSLSLSFLNPEPYTGDVWTVDSHPLPFGLKPHLD